MTPCIHLKYEINEGELYRQRKMFTVSKFRIYFIVIKSGLNVYICYVANSYYCFGVYALNCNIKC